MGDANVTRDQFDEAKNVVRKIAQTDTYIMDADFNEAVQIDEHRAARMLGNLIKDQLVRFGVGWLISGGSNSVTVAAGDAALELEDEKYYIFHLADDVVVSGWTTPVGSDRTDHLYLDVELAIVDAADDPTLVNPDVGLETAVDVRLQFTWSQQEGGTVPDAPDGHYYVTIATIARHAGQATINLADISNALAHYEPLESSGLVNLKGDMLCDSGITFDKLDPSLSREMLYTQALQAAYGAGGYEAVAWTDEDNSCWHAQGGSGSGYDVKVRIPLSKKANVKKIYLRCEARNLYSTAEMNIGLSVNGFTRVTGSVPQNSGWAWYEISVDVSSATNNADISIDVEVQDNIGAALRIRKVQLWAGVE